MSLPAYVGVSPTARARVGQLPYTPVQPLSSDWKTVPHSPLLGGRSTSGKGSCPFGPARGAVPCSSTGSVIQMCPDRPGGLTSPSSGRTPRLSLRRPGGTPSIIFCPGRLGGVSLWPCLLTPTLFRFELPVSIRYSFYFHLPLKTLCLSLSPFSLLTYLILFHLKISLPTLPPCLLLIPLLLSRGLSWVPCSLTPIPCPLPLCPVPTCLSLSCSIPHSHDLSVAYLYVSLWIWGGAVEGRH